MAIVPYTSTSEVRSAAAAFNRRMREANAPVDFLLPESEAPEFDPVAAVTKRQHVVVQGQAARGGVIIQEQPAWVGGETRVVWNVQAPLSEGIGDKRYSYVATFLMRELLRMNPLIYSVGMGSASRPYPRLLQALRWRLCEVPFYFRICNGRNFLRQIRPLRTSKTRNAVLNLAAVSGLGGAAMAIVTFSRCANSAVGPMRLGSAAKPSTLSARFAIRRR
jgi:hypothetical protein